MKKISIKKTLSLILVFIILLFLINTNIKIKAESYMSDKTEIPINLEVSGAEAICQTEDGFVWIAQYSGLTRYDSKDFETYKSFTYDGEEHSIINVRNLASSGNTVYIGTSSSIYKYENNEFSVIEKDCGNVQDVVLDKDHDLLYVSTQDKGGLIYNLTNNTKIVIPNTEGKSVNDIALDTKRDNYYYQLDTGVYDKNGNEIYLYPKILDIYSYDDILYIGEDADSGLIHRYNMETKTFIEDINVADQVNKILYSEEDNTLFVACEKIGLCCVDLSTSTPSISLATGLENSSQLIDLMIDYQGNLWVASHYIGASGVSIITKNALLELLYDDAIWQSLDAPPAFDRNVYAVEKYGDILYIAAASRIYLFDIKEKTILPDNIIMKTIDEYATANGLSCSPKDVEVHKGKIYFAISGIGIVEYDPNINNVKIYGVDYITSHIDKLVNDPELSVTTNVRALRSFDDYLAIGYNKGLMKFDGEKFSVMYIGSNVLYINKTNDGKLLFDRTKGLFIVDDDFENLEELPTGKPDDGNRLKFLVDGDYIYYTLNSRLFRLEQVNGEYVSKEIAIPYVKGSLVELAKVEYTPTTGEDKYKYVIVSQSQIYIASTLDGDYLTDYEFFDETNGLQPIIANTSGFYDKEEQLYYFQSTNGIFVYNFNEKKAVSVPSKMTVSSVDLDGEHFYSNAINISKDTNRVAFNISVFGFTPNKGYTIYYKLDGIDNDYNVTTADDRSIYYTNLPGGSYTFVVYAVDEFGQPTNEVEINLVKEKHIYEQIWFLVVLGVLSLGLIVFIAFIIIHIKTKQSLKKQLEYKNITVESIQAIARTIDAKDEYTNGHSIRVGHYSRLIAQNLGMKEDDVNNIYYIALLHDIGKIAIPDSILNKPGRLTDEEFAVMKSHTTRGAKILKGISTIPQIIEGAKSHHEKYDGSGYPEGLKGEDIPFVARIICCADCFDAMASKRVYKEPFDLDKIISEFERCSGTQFDPYISQVVIKMIKENILKPYTGENTYLGSDGKTHRIKKADSIE